MKRKVGRWLTCCAATGAVLAAGPGAARAATICFEAEHASSLSYPFEVFEHRQASGGIAVRVPEGAGERGSFDEDSGTATYYFSVRQAGSYQLRLRMWCRDVCGNSVLVRLGEGKLRQLTSYRLVHWHWAYGGPCTLKAGLNKLEILNREDGVGVDQVWFETGDFKDTDEPRPANVVPRPPLDAGAPLAVFFSAGALTRYGPFKERSTHRSEHSAPLDRARPIIVTPGAPTTFTVWLRNNSLAASEGKVTLLGEALADIQPGREQGFRMQQGAPLTKVAFSITARPAMPRRAHALTLSVRNGDALVEERTVHLVRPYAWLMTGHFPCAKPEEIERAMPLEGQLGRGFPGPFGGLTWRAVPENAVTPFGMVDVREALGARGNVAAYAYTRIECREAGDYLLDVRHDDMVRVWLNGELVLTGLECLPAVLTRKLVRVKLKEGDNHVVVKIGQVEGFWEFGLQVLTKDRKPADVVGADLQGLLGP
jgi:hypothetical protein